MYKTHFLDFLNMEITLKYGMFSYNTFVKLHGKNIWEPQHDSVTSKSVCSKRTALYVATMHVEFIV